MRFPTNRERLLAGVGVIAAAALWLSFRALPEYARPARTAPEIRDLGDPPYVLMGLLDLGATPLAGTGRDLFAYRKPARAEPLPTVHTAALAEVRTADVQRRPVADPPLVDARPPWPKFKYVGFVGPRDRRIAVFDEGGEVLLAQVGDVIAGQYEVVRFDYEAILLAIVGGPFDGRTVTLRQEKG